ncbi:hypothetical protein FG385_10350 [Amycolatopsis alkalitolerans]|uniref:Glycosyltransferase RgtA/B/C/D-like domain-containing protein n=1 Tax=Amycolatopsis alkalitolerans TaxID=2547244 RepID=A0A5C4M592_9PSEU|nr:hypothetical protein FG385_10350 [Amycolatopsis alkalitolerans]
MAALVAVATTVLWTGLNHDVHYVLGCLRVAELPASAVFVHRPLGDRLFMAALSPLGSDALIRLGALVLLAGVVWWLRTALRRPEATLVATATGLALALAPNWDFLQPEWIASLLATAAVAGALWPRRLWFSALLGGFFAALAVLVKYTTLPAALIAIGVVLVLDRRRAFAMAAAAVPLGGALFALAVAIEPREWRWLHEFSVLNGASPLGGAPMDFTDLWRTVANEAVQAPLLALAPVSVVVIFRVVRGWWPVLPALGAAAVFAATLVQAQWFQYHLDALLPLSAGLWGFAVARWYSAFGRPPWALVLATAALAVAEPLAAAKSHSWRVSHAVTVYWVLIAVVALAVVAAALEPVRGGRPLFAVPVLVAVAALAVPVWPSSPYSFDFGWSDSTNADRVRAFTTTTAEMAGVRDAIGADTPVLYLTFGDVDYYLGNPTPCRYPSPVFLQRGMRLPEVRTLRSYAENAACLADPTPRYLVVAPAWFDLKALEPGLAGEISRSYDCERAITTDTLVVCPRR